MGRRGPKPTPRALKLLRHTTTTTRQPTAALGVDPPVMPAGLSAIEQAAWAGLQAELAAVPGLASRADRGVCELAARLEPAMRAAAEVVRDSGSTLTVYDGEGNIRYTQSRPEATFMLKTGALLKTLYAELGLSPSGRSRVSVNPAPAKSKLDSYLQGRTHGA